MSVMLYDDHSNIIEAVSSIALYFNELQARDAGCDSQYFLLTDTGHRASETATGNLLPNLIFLKKYRFHMSTYSKSSTHFSKKWYLWHWPILIGSNSALGQFLNGPYCWHLWCDLVTHYECAILKIVYKLWVLAGLPQSMYVTSNDIIQSLNVTWLSKMWLLFCRSLSPVYMILPRPQTYRSP